MERTCVGCGGKADPGDLLRLSATGGRLRPDPDRRRGGRGAWLHRAPACLEKALKRGAFARALRQPGIAVDGAEVARLLTGIAPAV